MAKKVLLRLGAVVSAIGVLNSGLTFLQGVPIDLSSRFWDGGTAATITAAVLDIACGSVMCYLAANAVLGIDTRRHARSALIVSTVAILCDWIGGLWGISALVGLASSYFLTCEA